MNNFILNSFEWSFSRIESFEICPYAFYLNYIRELKNAESFFGQYGSFAHNLLERFNKGKLFDFQLIDEYEQHYNEFVTEKVNDKISDSYYNKGYSFFENFTEPDYKVLGSECSYTFQVGEYNFRGVIDVEGENFILDYKTKTGKTYKKPKDDADYRELEDGRYIDLSNFKQLYTYCIPYYTKYNKYPDKLILEMIKMNDRYTLKFDYKDFIYVQECLIKAINKIYETVEFIKNEDDFWCSQICGQRYNCDRKGKIEYVCE